MTGLGPALDAHVDACAERIRSVLEHMPGLKRYALDHGPSGWGRHYAAQPGPPLLDRLFMERLRVSGDLAGAENLIRPGRRSYSLSAAV